MKKILIIIGVSIMLLGCDIQDNMEHQQRMRDVEYREALLDLKEEAEIQLIYIETKKLLDSLKGEGILKKF